MSTDYTKWATPGDVELRLASAGVTLRKVDLARRFAQALEAVTSEVAQKTKRQWIAVDDVRLFDGSGTAEQEIDEIVSFTDVSVVGFQVDPGYTLAGVQIIREQLRPSTRLVVSRGSLPALGTSGVIVPYPCIFPAGRQNIQVTGVFGYGAQIPAALWDAVCGEIACRLTAEALFSPGGRLSSRKVGDEEERYKLPEATDMEWRCQYAAALTNFKRPDGRRLRNLRPRMI